MERRLECSPAAGDRIRTGQVPLHIICDVTDGEDGRQGKSAKLHSPYDRLLEVGTKLYAA